jgi:rare lipoprotein A
MPCPRQKEIFVGSSTGKHGAKQISRLHKILIFSGVALVAAVGAAAWVFVPSDARADRTTAGSQAAALLPPTAQGSPTPSPSQTSGNSPQAQTQPQPTPSVKTITPKPKPKHKKPSYSVVSSGECEASYYGDPQTTASGETFNPNALTAANRTLPFGTHVRVTNEANGESVIVRINDRGPYAGGRCLDLSTAAMRAVGGLGAGVIQVRYQVLSR